MKVLSTIPVRALAACSSRGSAARSRMASDRTPRWVAALASLALTGAASADTFTVTTLADGPVTGAGSLPGSLRQAIYDADALAGADTIQFDSSLSGTITLTEGELAIREGVTIEGPGADKLTISGGNTSRVLRFVEGVSGVHTFTLRGLTFADGNGVSPVWNNDGAAILFFFTGNDDTLNIDSCVIRDNTHDAQNGVGVGTAIGVARGTLNLTNSSILDNAVGIGDNGQGIIYVQDGRCTIVNSTFSGNAGNFGTVWVRGSFFDSQVSISHSTFYDNDNYAVQLAGDSATTCDYDHTIFADNWATFKDPGTVTLTSGGYNILDDSTDPSPASTDKTNTDPLLEPLEEDNGTFVHPLTKASPAINGGNPSAVAGVNGVPVYDQRRGSFPRVHDGGLDIGAVEFSGFLVTTLADGAVSQAGDLPGSLRQAVFDYNAMRVGCRCPDWAGPQTIEFADSLSGGTITLTEGEIFIDRTLLINGLGADKLTISGGNNSRVFRCGGWEPNTYTFRGLTISDGNGVSPVWTNRGGAFNMYFAHDDTLHIDQCVIRDSTTNPNVNLPFGNAVAVLSGTLIISNSAIIDNGVDGTKGGERSTIYVSENFPSHAHFINTTFSGNTGNEGVVWIRGGFKGISATFSYCTFVNNDNNGVRITGGPTTGATYSHSIFSGNAGSNWSFSVNGPISSGGYNILDDSTGRGAHSTDLLDTNPLLCELEERDGTFVHMLRPGSPALNGGDPNVAVGLTGVPDYDQRGEGFSRVVGGQVDIGAVENTEQYCSAADFAAPYGTLNIADFLGFQNSFVSGGCWADMNSDGVLNFFDFVAFQEAYIKGCN